MDDMGSGNGNVLQDYQNAGDSYVTILKAFFMGLCFYRWVSLHNPSGRRDPFVDHF